MGLPSALYPKGIQHFAAGQPKKAWPLLFWVGAKKECKRSCCWRRWPPLKDDCVSKTNPKPYKHKQTSKIPHLAWSSSEFKVLDLWRLRHKSALKKNLAPKKGGKSAPINNEWKTKKWVFNWNSSPKNSSTSEWYNRDECKKQSASPTNHECTFANFSKGMELNILLSNSIKRLRDQLLMPHVYAWCMGKGEKKR